jgi:hypothetical protein
MNLTHNKWIFKSRQDKEMKPTTINLTGPTPATSSFVAEMTTVAGRACIVERGTRTSIARKGTPQGGVISPFLSNVYLRRFDRFWWKKRAS